MTGHLWIVPEGRKLYAFRTRAKALAHAFGGEVHRYIPAKGNQVLTTRGKATGSTQSPPERSDKNAPKGFGRA